LQGEIKTLHKSHCAEDVKDCPCEDPDVIICAHRDDDQSRQATLPLKHELNYVVWSAIFAGQLGLIG
jgi:hypothetical protein